MKKSVYSLAVIVLALAASTQAALITVENNSFEQPGDAKHNNWDAVPGWNSDTTASDSGVESDWPGHTDGVWSGYLMGTDPSTHNLTTHMIVPGEQFTLTVDSRNNWSEVTPAQLQMDLYYDDAGTRVQVATGLMDLTDDWTSYSVTFSADDAPLAYGHNIGIELNNPATSGSWIGLDNVRLEVVPEPATLALLGFGGLSLLRRKRS